MQTLTNNKYTFLKGKLVDFKPNSTSKSPHYEVTITANNQEYNIIINVLSRAYANQYDSKNLKYYITKTIPNDLLIQILTKKDGAYQDLAIGASGICLDYIRSNIFDIKKMEIMPIIADEEVKKLETMFAANLQLILQKPEFKICAWGMYFCTPYLGIHDVHMNQGNYLPEFAKDNGIWQDGGFIIINEKNQTVKLAIFLAFQAQCIKKDDNGDCLK